MISKVDKNADRLKRHARVRKNLSGTAERPRLSVYRSLNHIYAQIIDDVNGKTLVACSTKEKAVAEQLGEKTKVEQAKIVGLELAKRHSLKALKT
jgi:large subunit ribosomal protein L18